MAHDDQTPTDLEATQMMGRPEDFTGLMMPPPSTATVERMLAEHRLDLRIRGVFYESPMADLQRGGR